MNWRFLLLFVVCLIGIVPCRGPTFLGAGVGYEAMMKKDLMTGKHGKQKSTKSVRFMSSTEFCSTSCGFKKVSLRRTHQRNWNLSSRDAVQQTSFAYCWELNGNSIVRGSYIACLACYWSCILELTGTLFLGLSVITQVFYKYTGVRTIIIAWHFTLGLEFKRSRLEL